MYRVIILPLAKGDIKHAAAWYERQQKGLGKRFTEAIRAKIKEIKRIPEAYRIRREETRTALTDIFPFRIHFIIQGRTILVSAVTHTSRHLDIGQDRS